MGEYICEVTDANETIASPSTRVTVYGAAPLMGWAGMMALAGVIAWAGRKSFSRDRMGGEI